MTTPTAAQRHTWRSETAAPRPSRPSAALTSAQQPGYSRCPDDIIPRADGQIEGQNQDLNAAQMLARFQQILAAHQDRPEQQADENRYRNLAARLLEETGQLAAELADANLPDQERDQEFERRSKAFERRSKAIDRFATIWNAEDPLAARLPRHAQDREPKAGTLLNALPWTPLLALPGYDGENRLNSAIRTLGRRIFRAFPCFGKLSAAAQEADVDPLGEVMALSAMIPDQSEIVRSSIEALKTSCLPIAENRLPGLSAMPGYRPAIAISLSDETSFLIVRERQATGAPINADSIYAWDRGTAFYHANPERIADLRRLLHGPLRKMIVQTATALRLT